MKSYLSFIRIGIMSFYLGFKSRGVKDTFLMFFEALIDERYNKKSGLDLSSFFDPVDSEHKFMHKKQANFYQPVRVRPFSKLLKHLNINPVGRFVDIGVGKGKALFLADEYGFKHLIGVELVPELCKIAEENIKHYKNSCSTDSEYSILQMSATEYELHPEDQIIFLNDPFDNEVMSEFTEVVIKGLKQLKQKTYFIYKNNNKRPMPSLEKLKEKGSYSTFNSWGNLFEIIIFDI